MVTPTPAPPVLLSNSAPESRPGRHNRRIGGENWSLIEHPPNVRRKSRVSQIWTHGGEYLNTNRPQEDPRWICDLCNSIISIRGTHGTFNINRHLLNKHGIAVKRIRSEVEEEEEETRSETRSESRSESHSQPRRQQIFSTLIAPVNIDVFRERLVQWIIQCQVPFTAVEQEQFRQLLLCIQPSLDRYLIRSHNTVASWLRDSYQEARESLKFKLSQARSKIHLSFDIWTSPSCSAIIGICSHFVDTQYQLRHALLALKEIEGLHSGERIAEIVGDLIEESAIQANLGVFVGDNASNIDVAVRALVHRFLPDEENEPHSRRSRCLGHIINLAAKAFLLGNDYEAFIDEIDTAERATTRDQANLAAEQAKWRIKGPIGKFHNIVTFIRASPQRRQEFATSIKAIIEQSQSAEDTDLDFSSSLSVILENSTRWNSTFLSIQRGLRLKSCIQLFLLQHSDALNQDLLTEEDWNQLENISKALKPFWEVTMRLQGHAIAGSHGAIWEALPSLDYLLTTIESAKQRLEEEDSHRGRDSINPLLIAYQNAWEKLLKYNNLTDDNHEIYAAATLLNPCCRRRYFSLRWQDESAQYIEPMIAKNRKIWESRYSQNRLQEPQPASESFLDLFMNSSLSQGRTDLDEFDSYTKARPTDLVDWRKHNIFVWWMQCDYSGLRQWALDTLSVPAMSSEIERVFSQAKRLITSDRNRLSNDLVEASICMKHWLDNKTLE
jgi:hypothetical protein